MDVFNGVFFYVPASLFWDLKKKESEPESSSRGGVFGIALSGNHGGEGEVYSFRKKLLKR
jgi:hypothetical protein